MHRQSMIIRSRIKCKTGSAVRNPDNTHKAHERGNGKKPVATCSRCGMPFDERGMCSAECDGMSEAEAALDYAIRCASGEFIAPSRSGMRKKRTA